MSRSGKINKFIQFYRVILLYMIFIMVFALVCRWLIDLTISISLLEIYYSIIGSVYAIIVGFVLLMVVSNFNDVRRNIYNEVNALQDLRDLMGLIQVEGCQKENVLAAIKHYAHSVCLENKAFIDGEDISSDTCPELYDLLNSIRALNINSNLIYKIALKSMIKAFMNITTFRTNRVSSLHEKVPTVMMHLIGFMSAAIILPLFFLKTSMALWIAVNTMVVICILFIYLVIRDLNEPAKGFWSVSYHEHQKIYED